MRMPRHNRGIQTQEASTLVQQGFMTTDANDADSKHRFGARYTRRSCHWDPPLWLLVLVSYTSPSPLTKAKPPPGSSPSYPRTPDCAKFSCASGPFGHRPASLAEAPRGVFRAMRTLDLIDSTCSRAAAQFASSCRPARVIYESDTRSRGNDVQRRHSANRYEPRTTL